MDLSKAKYLVPNALTLGSIYCGISSIHLSTTAQSPKDMMMAAWLIVIVVAFRYRHRIKFGLEGPLNTSLDMEAENRPPAPALRAHPNQRAGRPRSRP